jgi:hypothetical protein
MARYFPHPQPRFRTEHIAPELARRGRYLIESTGTSGTGDLGCLMAVIVLIMVLVGGLVFRPLTLFARWLGSVAPAAGTDPTGFGSVVLGTGFCVAAITALLAVRALTNPTMTTAIALAALGVIAWTVVYVVSPAVVPAELPAISRPLTALLITALAVGTGMARGKWRTPRWVHLGLVALFFGFAAWFARTHQQWSDAPAARLWWEANFGAHSFPSAANSALTAVFLAVCGVSASMAVATAVRTAGRAGAR